MGDGAITATSSDESVAKVSVDGTTLTITGVGEGTATVTVNVAEGTNHTAASATVSVTSAVVTKSVLNNDPWPLISSRAIAGTGDTYYDVGDAKEVALNGKVGDYCTLENEKLCVFIGHINMPINNEPDNNIIFLGFKSAVENGVDVTLVDGKYDIVLRNGELCFTINHKTGSNYEGNFGGWKGTDFRYDILGATNMPPSQYNQLKSTANVGYDADGSEFANPKANTLLAAFPSDLRAVMRLWTRYVDVVGNKSNVDENIKPTVDAISLLSEYELCGLNLSANEYEKDHQKQMAYYEDGNSKIRYKHLSPTIKTFWWLCSAASSTNNSFCYFGMDNRVENNGMSRAAALAPAFKV